MQPNGTASSAEHGDLASKGAALGTEFRHLVSDLEDLIKSATHLSGDDLSRAKQAIEERVSVAREKLDSVSGLVADKARSTAQATDTYVHEQPWRAVGIATAVGVLLGMLMTRR
jgi:ElaB/YqjD/DUF883 family membrane-anchored ribosome-binding protein